MTLQAICTEMASSTVLTTSATASIAEMFNIRLSKVPPKMLKRNTNLTDKVSGKLLVTQIADMKVSGHTERETDMVSCTRKYLRI